MFHENNHIALKILFNNLHCLQTLVFNFPCFSPPTTRRGARTKTTLQIAIKILIRPLMNFILESNRTEKPTVPIKLSQLTLQ